MLFNSCLPQKRYGHDFGSFSPHPTVSLSAHLLDLAQAMPIHILPGPTDPSGTILPQQPLPRAMLGTAASFSSFRCETNPTYLRIGTNDQPHLTKTFLINSGQPVNDMFKYLPSPPNSQFLLAESTLRWRHMAPTAPDTLWCHPYFSMDPFIIQETPDVYIIGDQPRFQTKMVVDEDSETKSRLILVPRFAETGTMVLVNLRTLDTRTVQFAIEGIDRGESEA
jgi:DNA polymerase delta subunit 2